MSFSSDISATRDLAVVAILGYAYWKLKDYLKSPDFKDVLAGGDLRRAWDTRNVGRTQTESPQDVAMTWTDIFRGSLGRNAPVVPTPPHVVDIPTFSDWTQQEQPQFEVHQGTIEILPLPMSTATPVLTRDIWNMITAPAPNRPVIDLKPYLQGNVYHIMS